MSDNHTHHEEIARQRRGRADYRAGYDQARRAFVIGQAVRERRLALGLSQTELAAGAGMTQSALSRLEADGAVPTIPVLERIATALGAGTHRHDCSARGLDPARNKPNASYLPAGGLEMSISPGVGSTRLTLSWPTVTVGSSGSRSRLGNLSRTATLAVYVPSRASTATYFVEASSSRQVAHRRSSTTTCGRCPWRGSAVRASGGEEPKCA